MILEEIVEKVKDGSLLELDLGTSDDLEKIGYEGAKILANALRSPHCRLTHLVLWGNDISDEGIAAIAAVLPGSTITVLNLAHNSIGYKGVKALLSALRNPECNVRSLNVCHNKFGDSGIVAFSSLLKEPSCRLTSLNLAINRAGHEGNEAVATVLKSSSCKLVWLDFSGNNHRADAQGVSAILDAIESNHALLYFGLFIGGPIPEPIELCNILRRNRATFTAICDSILQDIAVMSHDKERLFLQCHTIASDEKQSKKSMIPDESIRSLACRVIQQLEQEYEITLTAHLSIVANMPTALTKVIMEYVKENDSQLYVSFSNADNIASGSHEGVRLLSYHSRKRKSDSVCKPVQKRAQVEREDEEERAEAYNSDDNVGGAMDSAASDSSVDGSAEDKRASSRDMALFLEQSDGEQAPIYHQLAVGQYANNTHGQILSQADNGKDDIVGTLLMTLFAWIKDLPNMLQQQVLSSFGMQRVLKVLESTTHPYKFVLNQLDDRSIEEKFITEHQKYYGNDHLCLTNSQIEAQMSQYDSSALLNYDGIVISSNGILIDPLPKHDINFKTPYLCGDLMSF